MKKAIKFLVEVFVVFLAYILIMGILFLGWAALLGCLDFGRGVNEGHFGPWFGMFLTWALPPTWAFYAGCKKLDSISSS